MRSQKRSQKKSVKQKKVTDNVSPQGKNPQSYLPDEKDRVIQYLREYSYSKDEELQKAYRKNGELTALLNRPLFVDFEIIPVDVRYTALKKLVNSKSFKN